MSNTALILGSSGLIGRHLLDQLVHDPKWNRIIVLTRRHLGLNDTKIVEVIGDSDTIEASAAKLKAHTIFCCLGTTQAKAGSQDNFRKIDHDYVVRCAEITHQQGAKRFVFISSVGAKVGSASFYAHVKGETERDLAAIGFETLDILRPSLLLGDRDESRPLEDLGRFLAPLLSVILIGPLRKYRPIKGEQVARAMNLIASSKHKGVRVHTFDSLASF